MIRSSSTHLIVDDTLIHESESCIMGTSSDHSTLLQTQMFTATAQMHFVITIQMKNSHHQQARNQCLVSNACHNKTRILIPRGRPFARRKRWPKPGPTSTNQDQPGTQQWICSISHRLRTNQDQPGPTRTNQEHDSGSAVFRTS